MEFLAFGNGLLGRRRFAGRRSRHFIARRYILDRRQRLGATVQRQRQKDEAEPSSDRQVLWKFRAVLHGTLVRCVFVREGRRGNCRTSRRRNKWEFVLVVVLVPRPRSHESGRRIDGRGRERRTRRIDLNLPWDQGPIVAVGRNFYDVAAMRIEIVFVVTPLFQPEGKPPPPPTSNPRKAEDA